MEGIGLNFALKYEDELTKGEQAFLYNVFTRIEPTPVNEADKDLTFRAALEERMNELD